MMFIIALVLVVTGVFSYQGYCSYAKTVSSYNKSVGEYNTTAQEYINLIQKSSVDNIKNLPTKLTFKNREDKNFISFVSNLFSKKKIQKRESEVKNKTSELVADYMTVNQITNPSEDWVINRLKGISEITGTAPVTEDNDPNGYLGKDGGYTSCIYFSDSNVDQSVVDGSDIIEKGCDGGGAVEVYKNKNDATNRCEYLSKFDGTLLYTGSYAVIGTMVIRTSYLLSDDQQLELTNKISQAVLKLNA